MEEFLGCLVEGIVEIIFETLAEFIAGMIFSGIVIFFPKAKRESKALRSISIIIAILLMFMPIVGIFLIVQEKGAARIAGIIMAAVPCLLFVIGFVVSAVKEMRENKNGEESFDEGDQS